MAEGTVSGVVEAVSAGTSRASTADFPAVVRTATGSVPSGRAVPNGARNWRARYARALRITDFVIIVGVVFGTQLGWLGFHTQVAMPVQTWPGVSSYTALSCLIVLSWLLALAVADTRSARVIGVGPVEYQRVFNSSVMLFGLIAIAAFLLQVEASRGYLLIALPAGVLLLLLGRYLWRVWLRAKRRKGEYSARVLLVGSERSVKHTADELRRSRSAGYIVAGACIPAHRSAEVLDGSDIPVMGGVSSVESALKLTGADTVVITSTDELGPTRVKQISWTLEAGKQHLVLAPSITDIAGPRIHTRPVAGLPLMHVETPRFSPAQRFVKRMMDIFGSLFMLLLLSPAFLVISLLVLFTPGRPVIYKQARIGRHGREFRMWKFRSMIPDAEGMLQSLLDAQDHGNRVQFKMKNDPRITPIGRVLRKYSLDELPQLFNVLGGSMSLVGPRPPIQREVEQYDDHVHRRFLVKPGITGLWQVSGRSSLSWDDSVRLDLSYVENWSVMSDLVILFKTFKAALVPGDTTG
ncbi:polyprenyl glycosylphosphotransferase [Microbacterium faecale]|uniref:Polyprenyl glycosylphosphotransferase n=1 Tax=Microbacterium faecale TaxID=1804630 RepID=A0A917DEY2_9MICO|nr:sugar transferase [Microbacterium faecale]GGD31481.1 polyprenyl glycosylphosphotransferase [Microbacterium faecale]